MLLSILKQSAHTWTEREREKSFLECRTILIHSMHGWTVGRRQKTAKTRRKLNGRKLTRTERGSAAV